MSNVVDLNCISSLPLQPERVLAKASGQKFERVLIIGITEDGAEYFASSDPDGGTAVWDLERAKHKLMRVADRVSDEQQ